nr:hypothetical protein [Tanacetum cinerariifolium]
MVDFVEASPLRYDLTVKPTVYVSHIRQFWSTARIETTEEGTKILATVDGFNEFSSNNATALVCLATNWTYNFSKIIFDGLVKNVNNKERVKLLENKEGVAAEGSRNDALIKGRNFDEGEAAAERASDDTEEVATVITSMDAATFLASGAAEVPTGSGLIPTADPSAAEEEAKRFKRKGIRFEQESTMKLKPSEEVTEEAKSPDEVPEEKVKEMMQLVPIEEVYVEALQGRFKPIMEISEGDF